MSDLLRKKGVKVQFWADMPIFGIVWDRMVGVVAFGFGPVNVSIKYRE